MFVINFRIGEILLKGRLDRGKISNFLLLV